MEKRSDVELAAAFYGSSGTETKAPGSDNEGLHAAHGGLEVTQSPSIGQPGDPTPQPKTLDRDPRKDSPPGQRFDFSQIEADDPETAAGLKEIVGNLPGDQVQKLVDLDAARSRRYYADLDKTWQKELDTDFGDGLDEAAGSVNRLIGKFDPRGEFVGFLKSANAQNCAPLFKFLHKISRHIDGGY